MSMPLPGSIPPVRTSKIEASLDECQHRGPILSAVAALGFATVAPAVEHRAHVPDTKTIYFWWPQRTPIHIPHGECDGNNIVWGQTVAREGSEDEDLRMQRSLAPEAEGLSPGV